MHGREASKHSLFLDMFFKYIFSYLDRLGDRRQARHNAILWQQFIQHGDQCRRRRLVAPFAPRGIGGKLVAKPERSQLLQRRGECGRHERGHGRGGQLPRLELAYLVQRALRAEGKGGRDAGPM